MFPWVREQFAGKTKSEFSELAAFVIIAFVLGHVLHALSHYIDQRPPWSCEGGIYGPNMVVYARQNQDLLSPKERDRLAELVKQQFDVNINDVKLDEREHLIAWCNVLTRITGAVYASKRGALADTLMRDYGP